MKKLTIALLAALALGACSEQEEAQNGVGRGLSFVPTVAQTDWNGSTTRAAVQPLVDGEGQTLYLHTMVTPIKEETVTRGTKYAGTTFATNETFRVSGYRYGSGQTVADVTAANFLSNAEVINDEGMWLARQNFNMPYAGDKIDFFAWFMPTGTSGVEAVDAAGGVQLTYTLPTSIAEQPDLLAAVYRNETYNGEENHTVPLAFGHQLTCVNFVIDDNVAPGTITEIAFLNVYTKATLSVGGSWNFTNGTKSEATAYATTYETTTTGGALKTGNERTVLSNLMMIPQTFTDAIQKIRVKMTIDGQPQTLFADLSPDLEHPTSWEAGTTVTYKISTSSVNVLRISGVTYPTSWNSATGVKSAYADGDTIGVFSVDADGKVIYANKKYMLNINGNTSTWVADDAATTVFVPGCTYYAYYPYKATLTGAPVANANVMSGNALPDAAQFFAGAVTKWSPAGDQSNATKLNNQDLQIGISTPNAAASTVNFTMAHTMGLVSLTMASANVAKALYYNPNGTENYRSAEKMAVVTSSSFTGNLPCAASGKHYFVVKPLTDTEFSATPSLGYDVWSNNITANVTAATYTNYDVASPIINRNYVYRGWVFGYTGSAQTFTIPKTGAYVMECWGSEGGTISNLNSNIHTSVTSQLVGGKGGYTKGTITMTKDDVLYVYVGNNSLVGSTSDYYGSPSFQCGFSFNGGGYADNSYGRKCGGGATDIRIKNGAWDNMTSLKSRIMVAAGGGSAGDRGDGYGGGSGGYAGGLVGQDSQNDSRTQQANKWYSWLGTGGTQTGTRAAIIWSAWDNKKPGWSASVDNMAGRFGKGMYGQDGEGGGGWYGGSGGGHCSGAGGSSYISGHSGCRAIKQTTTVDTGGEEYHETSSIAVIDNVSYTFTDTEMVDGANSQLQPDGTTTTGHSGVGRARITYTVVEVE